jgi:hypothetical protein
MTCGRDGGACHNCFGAMQCIDGGCQ